MGDYTEILSKLFYIELSGASRIKWQFKWAWMAYDLYCTMPQLCSDCTLEIALHLFFGCQFAATTWNLVMRDIRQITIARGESVQQLFTASYRLMTRERYLVAYSWHMFMNFGNT
jgi:hypothetical protein